MSIKKLQPQRWLDLSSPYVCNIFSNRVGREAWLLDPDDPPSGGGGDGGGGGGDQQPKTFTEAEVQARIDAAAGKIRNDEKKKYADFDKFKEAAGKLPELEQKLTELNASLEDTKLSADEKQRKAAERAAKQIETERAELTKAKKEAEDQAQSWKGKFLNGEISRAVGAALVAGNVLAGAQADAVSLFIAQSKIEHDDDGKISLIELNGVAHTDVASAATAFLKSKPHLVSGGKPPVGGGTKPPNAGGNGNDIANKSADQNISDGLARRLARG